MDPETSQRFAELEQRLAKAERRVEVLSRLRVDLASGGGQLTLSDSDAVLRIDQLTLSGQRLP